MINLPKRPLLSCHLLAVTLLLAFCQPQLSVAERYATSSNGANWEAIGLERAWQAQIGAGRKPAHITVHVSARKSTLAYEVKHPGGSKLFTPDHLSRFGRRLGEDGAMKAADLERRILETRNIKAEVITHRTARTRVYAQSAQGMLYAFDGETGNQLWNFPTGNPEYPSVSVGANDKFVAAVNGVKLYILNVSDGKLAFTKRLGGIPTSGVAMNDTHAFVPLMGKVVEGFRLSEKERRRPPVRFASNGYTRYQPVATPKSISWPAEGGMLYVVDAESTKVRYRMEARSALIDRAAYLAPDRLFASSQDGYLFCVDEETGRMMWQFSAGVRLVTAPVAIDDSVYVVAANGALIAVDAKSGSELWSVRGVRQVLSVGDDRIYAKAKQGGVLIINRKNGTRMGGMPVNGRDRFVTNPYSDRIYVTTERGQLLCLRDRKSKWPIVHVEPILEEDGSGSEGSDTKGSGTKGSDTKDSAEGSDIKDDGSSSMDEGEDIFGDTTDEGEDIFGDDADADAGDGGDDIFGDDAGGGDDDIFGDDEGGGEEGGDAGDDIFGEDGF